MSFALPLNYVFCAHSWPRPLPLRPTPTSCTIGPVPCPLRCAVHPALCHLILIPRPPAFPTPATRAHAPRPTQQTAGAKPHRPQAQGRSGKATTERMGTPLPAVAPLAEALAFSAPPPPHSWRPPREGEKGDGFGPPRTAPPIKLGKTVSRSDFVTQNTSSIVDYWASLPPQKPG